MAINMTQIKNLINETTLKLSLLGNSNKINKWSYYKPFNNSYAATRGLDLSNNYAYKRPSSFKMGDFINYNHGALPFIKIRQAPESEIVVPSIKFKIDESPGAINFLDLNLNNYYFGIKLTKGGISNYYSAAKVLGNSIEVSDTDIIEVETPLSSGSYSWMAFLSTARGTGGTAKPAGYIEFPSEVLRSGLFEKVTPLITKEKNITVGYQENSSGSAEITVAPNWMQTKLTISDANNVIKSVNASTTNVGNFTLGVTARGNTTGAQRTAAITIKDNNPGLASDVVVTITQLANPI